MRLAKSRLPTQAIRCAAEGQRNVPFGHRTKRFAAFSLYRMHKQDAAEAIAAGEGTPQRLTVLGRLLNHRRLYRHIGLQTPHFGSPIKVALKYLCHWYASIIKVNALTRLFKIPEFRVIDPDLIPRLCGMGVALGVASLFLDLHLILASAILIVISEATQIYCDQRFGEEWGSPLGVLYICSMLFGSAGFIFPFAIAWQLGELQHILVSLGTIFGGLLHTMVARGTEPIRKICVAIPIVCAFAYIPFQLYMMERYEDFVAAFSVFLALNVYFLHAYFLNLRSRADLVEAREAAEAANKAKTEFLAVMSHEIRTPLNGVLGMAQIIQLSAKDEKLRAKLEVIESSARSLEAIVDDVLDVAKIETGRTELRPEAYDLEALCRLLVEQFQPEATEKGLALTYLVEKAPPSLVEFDPARFRQCAANLISNALKYTPQGAVQVRLAWRDNEASIAFQDSGVGIAEADLSDVFAPYRRVHRDSLRDVGGMGLGLSVTKDLAELMGGGVAVQSIPGEGSTFVLTIHAPPGVKVDQSVQATEHGAPPSRVLVVDDIATNRLIARHLVSALGHEVTEASDGETALDMVDEEHFDLILMDMHMPGLDGPDVVAAIRQRQDDKATLPIIALTADHATGYKEKYRDLGMNGFVGKPIDKYELSSAIDRHLS